MANTPGDHTIHGTFPFAKQQFETAIAFGDSGALASTRCLSWNAAASSLALWHPGADVVSCLCLN